MVKEQGIIRKINGKKAVVHVQQTSACAHCKSKASCDVSKRAMLIEVANNLGAKEGDFVELSVPEGTVLKLSFMIYMMPIIALIIGAFVGWAVAGSFNIDTTFASILGGSLCVGLSFYILKRINRKAESEEKYFPHMIRILPNATLPAGAGGSK